MATKECAICRHSIPKNRNGYSTCSVEHGKELRKQKTSQVAAKPKQFQIRSVTTKLATPNQTPSALGTLAKETPAYTNWDPPLDELERLRDWQAGRCAICGSKWGDRKLDHCHKTGLIRGFLCSSDNTREGFSSPGTDWETYRRNPPARILNIVLPYYYYCSGWDGSGNWRETPDSWEEFDNWWVNHSDEGYARYATDWKLT